MLRIKINGASTSLTAAPTLMQGGSALQGLPCRGVSTSRWGRPANPVGGRCGMAPRVGDGVDGAGGCGGGAKRELRLTRR
jgi:hypothetical protein